mmetsp:Transcript_21349/g.60904  ORF Transcript_21349/g.60904 Transcript_21349/m.60904 type:complete len:235 (-) Transcript_21349:64-768(-)
MSSSVVWAGFSWTPTWSPCDHPRCGSTLYGELSATWLWRGRGLSLAWRRAVPTTKPRHGAGLGAANSRLGQSLPRRVIPRCCGRRNGICVRRRLRSGRMRMSSTCTASPWAPGCSPPWSTSGSVSATERASSACPMQRGAPQPRSRLPATLSSSESTASVAGSPTAAAAPATPRRAELLCGTSLLEHGRRPTWPRESRTTGSVRSVGAGLVRSLRIGGCRRWLSWRMQEPQAST